MSVTADGSAHIRHHSQGKTVASRLPIYDTIPKVRLSPHAWYLMGVPIYDTNPKVRLSPHASYLACFIHMQFAVIGSCFIYLIVYSTTPKIYHTLLILFMPPPFEEWWRGIKCYPCLCVRLSVRPLSNFGVCSITFERVHRFNSNLVCEYIISKHRSSSVWVTIH